MKHLLTIVMIFSVSIITACSGSGDHLITTEEEIQIMGKSMTDYMQKNGHSNMSKEEGCVLISDSLSEGLSSAASSFEAMNSWIQEFKEPSLAIVNPQTYTGQVAILILSMTNNGSSDSPCESKYLEGDIAEFVAYIEKNVYERAKVEKRQEKAKNIADKAIYGPKIEKIIEESQKFEYQCKENIEQDYEFASQNRNYKAVLAQYNEVFLEAKKCQKDFLRKKKEKNSIRKAKEEAKNKAAKEAQKVRDVKISKAIKSISEARSKIQQLDQTCVKSDAMLSQYQTFEYDYLKEIVIKGNGDENIDYYIQSVDKYIKKSKCK